MINIIFKTLYILTSLFVLFSCQSEQETQQKSEKEIELIPKGKIHIALDSITAVPYFNTQLFQDNQLVVLNSKINALQFYEFKDGGKMINRILLEKEGAEGVGSITKFLVHSPDSIFLLNAPQYRLYLVNSNAKIINTYSLIKGKMNKNTAMPDPFPFSKIVFVDDYIYLSSLPDRNPSDLSYYDGKLSAIKLNLENGEYEYVFGFPKVYKNNLFPNTFMIHDIEYVTSLNKFVYSYAADFNIQVTDLKHKDIQEHKTEVSLFDKIPPLPKAVQDEMLNNREGNKLPNFSIIKYLPHQKMIIRLASTPSLNSENRIQKQKGILVFLDENFLKVGESIFSEKDGFFPVNLHSNKQGIYILKQPDKEDEMVYECFEVVEK